MAEIIKARVWQKVDTLENWMANPLILGTGEFAPVLTAPGGTVFNFKVGVGNKRFSELEWSLQTPGTAIEANTSTVFPPGTPGLYIPTENGTYNGITVDLSAGYTQLIWDGTNLTDVVFPISFDPSKDSIVYGGSNTFKSNQYIIDGEVFNSASGWKWTGFLPATNAHDIVREGFTSGYFVTSFFDENKKPIGHVNTSGGNGTIAKADIPVGTRYIGANLYYNTQSTSNPDVSSTAIIYTKGSLYDTVDERVSMFQSEVLLNKKDEAEFYEKRHRVVVFKDYNDLVYSDGSFLSGTPGPDLGYAFGFEDRSRTPFWDIRQVNKIILSGFQPSLPTSRFFYDENLQTLGVIHGVNGVFDFNDFPDGSAYFGFTIEMPSIRLTGKERVMFVYNGDTADIEYYKRERYGVFDGIDSIDDEFLTGAGTVQSGSGNSWSGYLPIPQGVDLEIDGLVPGLNAKVFFDSSFNVLSVHSINNGVIQKALIPPTATYIGYNTRRTTVGDSRSTAEMFYVYDNAGESAGDIPDLSIPAIIPVAVGLQANIYKDNLRPNPINDTTEFFFNEGPLITGNSPNPYIWKTREVDRALQYMPLASENVPIIAMMRDRNYNILTRKDFQFVGIDDSVGNGQRKTIIVAGDSQIDTTFDGSKSSFAPYLKDLFVQSETVDMVFVGGKPMSATIYGENVGDNRVVTCPTEGQGSTTLGWLIGEDVQAGKVNPFLYGGSFDLAAYWDDARQSGNPYGLGPSEPLDYFLTPSGTNDFSIYGRTPDQVVARMVTLYGLIQAQMPATKLIIGIPTLGSKLWSMDTRRKWSIDYYRALIAEFEKPIYAGKVVLAAAALWTDNLFASRQLRKIVEPYQRIVDTKTQLYNKAIQGGATPEEADALVNDGYDLRVEERVFEKWMDEYPNTNDVTHSGYVGAMQQADCYYSAIKYAITL